jgi:phosphoglucosamine mutase
MLPTSALGAGLANDLADVGVMVTASHNPYLDNGFKVLVSGGRKLTEDETAQFETWLSEPPADGPMGTLIDVHQATRLAYYTALSDALPRRNRLAGRRIAVDLANGAGRASRDWLEAQVPVEWVFVGDDPDGLPNDGVGSEHPEALARAVVEHRCDAGIALDGDADRCRLVDEKGQTVPGDAIPWLLTRALGHSSLAVTVMSNGALELALSGTRIVRTPVGDRHLAYVMAEQGIPLGAEESGHVLFADGLPGGDGLVTGLRTLGLALQVGGLSDIVGRFDLLPSRKAKVPITTKPPLDSLPDLQRAVKKAEDALGPGGRVFLRYSGTEPVLRILVEGQDVDEVERVTAEMEELVRTALS